MSNEIEPVSIRPFEERVLKALVRPDMTSKELAPESQLTMSNVTRTATELVKLGLVSCRKAPGTKRVLYLFTRLDKPYVVRENTDRPGRPFDAKRKADARYEEVKHFVKVHKGDPGWYITNPMIMSLVYCSNHQAQTVLDRLVKEQIVEKIGLGKYYLYNPDSPYARLREKEQSRDLHDSVTQRLNDVATAKNTTPDGALKIILDLYDAIKEHADTDYIEGDADILVFAVKGQTASRLYRRKKTPDEPMDSVINRILEGKIHEQIR